MKHICTIILWSANKCKNYKIPTIFLGLPTQHVARMSTQRATALNGRQQVRLAPRRNVKRFLVLGGEKRKKKTQLVTTNGNTNSHSKHDVLRNKALSSFTAHFSSYTKYFPLKTTCYRIKLIHLSLSLVIIFWDILHRIYDIHKYQKTS
jgi:hypothetical protein